MDARLADLAASRGGVFTLDEAVRSGLSRDQVAARVQEGAWCRSAGGVLVPAGTPPGWRRNAWTAVLAVGEPVALRGRWSAVAWGLEHPELVGPVTLAVPAERRCTAAPGIEVHQLRFGDFSTSTRDGLPVLPLAVTLRDLAACLPQAQLLRVLGDCLRERRTTLERLDGVRGRGLMGSAALGRALRVVSPDHHGHWERLLHQRLRAAGERPAAQLRLRSRAGRTYYLDAAWPERRFGVEVDGFEIHASQFTEDRRRDRVLTFELGWTIAHVSVVEVALDVEAVVQEVLRLVRSRPVLPATG